MKAKLTVFFARLRPAIPLFWIVYALFVLATVIINISEFTFGVPVAIQPEVSTLASIILIIIGTTYAAYDILGGASGPLRWITLVLTYAVVGALGIGQLIGLAAGISMLFLPQKHMGDFVEIALLSTSIGLLIGVFGGILITLRRLSVGSIRKKILSIGLSGIAGGIISPAVALIFNIPYPIDAPRIFLPLIIGAFGAMIIQGILLLIYHRKQFHMRGLDKKPRYIFSWLDGSMGFVLALLLASSCALYVDDSNKESLFLLSLFLLTIPFIPSTGFAHFLFWRVSHLSKYTLAALGLALIVIGSLLQTHAPLSSIFGYLNPPKLNDTVRDGYFEFTVIDRRPCSIYKTPSSINATEEMYCVNVKVKNVDYSNEYRSFDHQNQQLIGEAGRSFWIEPKEGDKPTWVNITSGEETEQTLKFRYHGNTPKAIRLYGDEFGQSDGIEVKLDL